jgi:hypothetical protein
VADIIQIRRDTAATWTSVDPVLAEGEFAVETDTAQIKIGDGIGAWSTLPYLAAGPTGATGPEGPQGPQGIQGPSGTTTDTRISDPDIANWNTAYGWGDHATANYLVSTQDAVVGALTVNKTAVAATQTANATGSTALDFSTYQNFVLTLTGNTTLANPTTETLGQSGFIVIKQDATGGRTVSLGTEYKTASAGGLSLSAAALAVDVVPYIVAASGEILLGAPQLAFA